MKFKRHIPLAGENAIASAKPINSGRRTLLRSGFGLAAISTLSLAGCASWSTATAHRAGRSSKINVVKRESSFDEGWRFIRADISGAEASTFDDSEWRLVDLPHDWRIEDLPSATAIDSSSTNDPAGFAFTDGAGEATTFIRTIGPFDADSDAVPDVNLMQPGFGKVVIHGGASQGYTVGHIGWYRKRFILPKETSGYDTGRRIEIRFDGIFQNSTVWLNGHLIGFRANGYTPITHDITAFLNAEGNNLIAVKVDCTGKTSRWYAGSGIYRHTWITVTNPVYIPYSGVYVTTSETTANVTVTVSNTTLEIKNVAVKTTAINSEGISVATQSATMKQIAAGKQAEYIITMPIPNASLWSPESPVLYNLRSEVLVNDQVVDTVVIHFGIRSLIVNGENGMLLNGQRYVARGACIHHDHGPLGVTSHDRSEVRRIEVLKAAGFNAIRTSHNPHSPALLDACDRLGILVMDEFTDVWDLSKLPDDYSKYFAGSWRDDLSAFIRRDRNHPSVVMWSIGNEISADPKNFGSQQAALIRTLDCTRPILTGGGVNVGEIANSSWEYSDIGDAHYEVDLTKYHASHPAMAMCRSEDYANLVYEQTTFDDANPWMVGSFAWTGWDYIGESGIGAGIVARAGTSTSELTLLGVGTAIGKVGYPWYVGYSGDIDLIGQRKAQNYYRAVVYGKSELEVMVQRPAPAGTEQVVSAWSFYDELPSWTWDVPPGKLMTVRVLTRGDSVTLQLNGAILGSTTLTKDDQYIAVFSVPYASGILTAISTKNGAEIARKTLVTSGPPTAIRLTADVHFLSNDRNDLAHVLVEVVDAQGHLVPDAVVKVDMTASGAGKIIGVANGNPHNPDSFTRGDRWTWHGKALAVIRPQNAVGTVDMTANSPGLESGLLSLVVISNESPRLS